MEIPERYHKIIELAKSLDWEVEYSQKTGLKFTRGFTQIWECRDGWQCADLIHGYFRNHRGLKKDQTLQQLLEEG